MRTSTPRHRERVRLPVGAAGRGRLGGRVGLLGAVSAWLLSPAGPRQLQVRIWRLLWPLVGIALTVKQDQHGPPLLVGFAVGALLLRRDRRRRVSDMVAAAGSR
jgi:hypothetical protein